jgi:aminoglycoside phosphotransferase (APT) family kinase protein
MPDKPSAELEIGEELVRALVVSQATSLREVAALSLVHIAEGWDCSVWRLGSELAVRLPRRAVAAPLVLHEQRVLADVARRLSDSGVGVPTPVVAGVPGHGYPWSWSIVPWFEGTSGLGVPRQRRAGWAVPLARALLALHVAAPPDHPVNPVRGVPLEMRADAVDARLASLTGRVTDEALQSLRRLWSAALAAPPWGRAPVWLHGDLHPGNLVADGSQLVAIIDFGDVTAGDPAYDLAVAWLAFDASGRAEFVHALRDQYDAGDWTRAHGWAAAVTLMLLDQSDDNPEYARLGSESLAELMRR